MYTHNGISVNNGKCSDNSGTTAIQVFRKNNITIKIIEYQITQLGEKKSHKSVSFAELITNRKNIRTEHYLFMEKTGCRELVLRKDLQFHCKNTEEVDLYHHIEVDLR